MDLHVIGPLATPAERAAVDAVLGPPESGWRGGGRDSLTRGTWRVAGTKPGAAATCCCRRCTRCRIGSGRSPSPGMNYVCKRLSVPPAEAYGVATFYALFSTKPRPPAVAHVCDDIACRLAGAEETCADLERALGPAGAAARDGRIGWLRSPCLGMCEQAPAAMFTIAGESPVRETAAPIDAAGIVARLERAVSAAAGSAPAARRRRSRRGSRVRPAGRRAGAAAAPPSGDRRSVLA